MVCFKTSVSFPGMKTHPLTLILFLIESYDDLNQHERAGFFIRYLVRFVTDTKVKTWSKWAVWWEWWVCIKNIADTCTFITDYPAHVCSRSRSGGICATSQWFRNESAPQRTPWWESVPFSVRLVGWLTAARATTRRPKDPHCAATDEMTTTSWLRFTMTFTIFLYHGQRSSIIEAASFIRLFTAIALIGLMKYSSNHHILFIVERWILLVFWGVT